MALPWSSQDWLTSVAKWIGSQNIEVTGAVKDLHRRQWSAMLKIPTSEGSLFFKATAPSLTFEAALTQRLTDWCPDQTVELVAVDEERGWLLMRDSGVTLRSELARDPSAPSLEGIYRTFAQVQIAAIDHIDELLALGVPDRRLPMVEELGAKLGVDEKLLHSLVSSAAAIPLPDTLVHEEIHDANVLLRVNEPVFIDWSDSSIGHPFFGVVVGLRSLSDRLELEPGSPTLESCVDAYLQPWKRFAPVSNLRAVFPAAYRLGMLNRAISWQETLDDCDYNSKTEHLGYVNAWIAEFTAATNPLPGT
ncbi:MAG TPA: phosphotransferase [Actinomycetes bacterium]|nr:phosphotransferase [Actinomycetes bacterium]